MAATSLARLLMEPAAVRVRFIRHRGGQVAAVNWAVAGCRPSSLSLKQLVQVHQLSRCASFAPSTTAFDNPIPSICAGYICSSTAATDNSDVCIPSATQPVACEAGLVLCVDNSTLCNDGALTTCASGGSE